MVLWCLCIPPPLLSFLLPILPVLGRKLFDDISLRCELWIHDQGMGSEGKLCRTVPHRWRVILVRGTKSWRPKSDRCESADWNFHIPIQEFIRRLSGPKYPSVYKIHAPDILRERNLPHHGHHDQAACASRRDMEVSKTAGVRTGDTNFLAVSGENDLERDCG